MQSDQMQTYRIGDTTDTGLEDYTQLIVDLVSFSQTLCKQAYSTGERLCNAVVHATQGKAWLRLPWQDSPARHHIPFPVSVSFPVRFCNRSYGTLDIAPDLAHPASPALPLSVAQLLAYTCGSLLYALELSALIEGQCQRLDYQIPAHLTRREREVLDLICRGCNQQTIAAKLHIATATVDTYRKRIYEKLGVHHERDIPIAAYQAGLFSTLE